MPPRIRWCGAAGMPNRGSPQPQQQRVQHSRNREPQSPTETAPESPTNCAGPPRERIPGVWTAARPLHENEMDTESALCLQRCSPPGPEPEYSAKHKHAPCVWAESFVQAAQAVVVIPDPPRERRHPLSPHPPRGPNHPHSCWQPAVERSAAHPSPPLSSPLLHRPRHCSPRRQATPARRRR